MCPAQHSPDKFDIILSSIAQAQLRIQGIKQRQALQPMKYCARLAWEALYDARQILKNPHSQRQTYSKHQRRNRVSTSKLAQIEIKVEQIMSTLQIIEINDDLSAMDASAQSCLQHLNEITQILAGLE